MPAALPGHLRPRHHNPARCGDGTGQPVLHIGPQRSVTRQLRWFWTPRCPLGMPLRGRRRYSRPPPRVAALRRSSRETVDPDLPSRRPISRTPQPCARRIASSSRSANDRYRPQRGFDDEPRIDGGMPPASRNHRAPTAGDTPAPTAASSLDRPAAIAIQNRRRSSRRATPGRPGDRTSSRPDRSDLRFLTHIATSSARVLRRPIESTLATLVAVVDDVSTSLAHHHLHCIEHQLGTQ